MNGRDGERKSRNLVNSPTLSQAHEQLRNGLSPTAQLMQAAGSEIRLSANLRAETTLGANTGRLWRLLLPHVAEELRLHRLLQRQRRR